MTTKFEHKDDRHRSAELRESDRIAIEKIVWESGARGMTNDEVSESLRIPLQSVCGYRNALMKGGRLMLSGKTRQNTRGNQCDIFVHPKFSVGGGKA